MRFENNEMMLLVPRSLISLNNVESFELHFKWADGIKGDWSIEDFYLNGDTAPNGRLNFVFRS